MKFIQSNPKIIALLFLVVFLLHGQTVFNQYMIDDYLFLDPTVQNHFSSFADYFQTKQDRHYIPIYYMVNIHLFRHLGDLPIVVHSINLLLYFISILCIHYFILSLSKDRWLAFLTTLLFVLHPINAFIVQFSTANFVFIATAFTLIAFLLYLKAQSTPKRKALYFILSLCTYITAILTSEISVILPAFLFLYHFCIEKKSFVHSFLSKLWPYWLIAIAHITFYILLRGDTMNLSAAVTMLNLSPQTYIASFTHLATWYLMSLFNPKEIVFIQSTYPVEQNVAAYLGVFLAIIGTCIYLIFIRWKRDLKSFFLLFFLSGFCFVAMAMLAHSHMGLVIEPHWLYLFSIGFFALFAQLILWIKSKCSRQLFTLILICVLVFFTLETVRYHQLTKQEKTYLIYWVKHSPNNYIAWMRLAHVVAREEKFGEAILFANVAYQSAAYDKFSISKEIGKFYFLINALNRAEKYLKNAIKIKPDHPMSYYTLGELYQHKGDTEQAQHYFNLYQEKLNLLQK